jgi:hypothetical protein
MRVHLEKEELENRRGPSLLIQWFPWEIETLGHFRLFPDGARPIRLTCFAFFSLSRYRDGLALPLTSD